MTAEAVRAHGLLALWSVVTVVSEAAVVKPLRARSGPCSTHKGHLPAKSQQQMMHIACGCIDRYPACRSASRSDIHRSGNLLAHPVPDDDNAAPAESAVHSPRRCYMHRAASPGASGQPCPHGITGQQTHPHICFGSSSSSSTQPTSHLQDNLTWRQHAAVQPIVFTLRRVLEAMRTSV